MNSENIIKDVMNIVIEEEQEYLDEVLEKIKSYIDEKNKKLDYIKSELKNIVVDDSNQNYYFDLKDAKEELISDIDYAQSFLYSPYYGRMELLSDGSIKMCFIGDRELELDSETIIYGWRSQIGNLYRNVLDSNDYNRVYIIGKYGVIIKDSKVVSVNKESTDLISVKDNNKAIVKKENVDKDGALSLPKSAIKLSFSNYDKYAELFFEDRYDLKNTFDKLVRYSSKDKGLEIRVSNNYIGIAKEGERSRVYITKKDNIYSIKFKHLDTSENYSSDNYESYIKKYDDAVEYISIFGASLTNKKNNS